MMRNDKLIPGTILVIIGILLLLGNFGLIHFTWFNLVHLWPIILVIAGINLVFSHSRSGWVTFLKIIALIVGVLLLVFGSFHHHFRDNWDMGFHNRYNFDDRDGNGAFRDSVVKIEGSGSYIEPYDPTIQTARLNISGGGTTYTLKDATNQLFDAETKEYGNRYVLKKSMDGTTPVLDFNMNNRHGMPFDFDKRSNNANIKLNPNPEWEINLEAGAAKVNFDLSSLKIKKLKLAGGAASFDIKMGQPLVNTNVDISTGASAVTINIPRNAACHIVTDTGLSSKTFNGFQNIGDNDYETPGFDKAANKMYIHISGGVSDFKVKQY